LETGTHQGGKPLRFPRVGGVERLLTFPVPLEHLHGMFSEPAGHVAEAAGAQLPAAPGQTDRPQHQGRIASELPGKQPNGLADVVGEDRLDQACGRAVGHGENPSAGTGDEWR